MRELIATAIAWAKYWYYYFLELISLQPPCYNAGDIDNTIGCCQRDITIGVILPPGRLALPAASDNAQIII